MNLRTANHNHRRAVRRQALRDAFEFDYNRAIRPMTEAQLRRRANSGFVRRDRKRVKAWNRERTTYKVTGFAALEQMQ